MSVEERLHLSGLTLEEMRKEYENQLIGARVKLLDGRLGAEGYIVGWDEMLAYILFEGESEKTPISSHTRVIVQCWKSEVRGHSSNSPPIKVGREGWTTVSM